MPSDRQSVERVGAPVGGPWRVSRVAGEVIGPASAKVTRYTRAGRRGRVIGCPCGATAVVYHFAWFALRCQACGCFVEKHEWADMGLPS